MSLFTRDVSLAIAMTPAMTLVMTLAVTLGLAFTSPLSVPAFADSAQSNAPTQNDAAAMPRNGDLVRVRSGGPLMVVTDVQGDQVKCSWTDWLTGELKSETYPASVLGPPMVAPPDGPVSE